MNVTVPVATNLTTITSTLAGTRSTRCKKVAVLASRTAAGATPLRRASPTWEALRPRTSNLSSNCRQTTRSSPSTNSPRRRRRRRSSRRTRRTIKRCPRATSTVRMRRSGESYKVKKTRSRKEAVGI